MFGSNKKRSDDNLAREALINQALSRNNSDLDRIHLEALSNEDLVTVLREKIPSMKFITIDMLEGPNSSLTDSEILEKFIREREVGSKYKNLDIFADTPTDVEIKNALEKEILIKPDFPDIRSSTPYSSGTSDSAMTASPPPRKIWTLKKF